jgi:hypothetical protein
MTDNKRIVRGEFEDYLRELYRCRDCSLPGDPAPAPPAGRILSGARLDVLLVGWNAQVKGYRPDGTPPYERWRDDAAAEVEREVNKPGPFSRLVGRLLPRGLTLGDRVANTRVWKVPSARKEITDSERARICASKHLLRELGLLRPRLVLTYDKDAARFFVNQAEALGVSVVTQSQWPSVVGWSNPHRAWGWPLALLAVTGKRDKTHAEVAYIQEKGAELLAECNRLEREPCPEVE